MIKEVYDALAACSKNQDETFGKGGSERIQGISPKEK